MRVALYLCFLLLLFSACKDGGNPINGDKPPCPPIRIAAPSPYGEPVWHPSGGFIGFNYMPLIRITYPYGEHCQGEYEWKWDSSGYWLIKPDGTNMRRVFPYGLEMVSWSPDGEWIAFGAGAQIYKMRFTGTTFDTTTLTQLTFEGRNFLPAWSPDPGGGAGGQWIAYDNTTCGNTFEPPPPNSCGILVMRNDGTEKKLLMNARMPTWHPNGQSLLGVIGTSPTSIWKRFVRYYPFQTVQPDTLLAVVGNDNRHPKYCPDGTKIAFGSKPADGRFNIWVMNVDGSQPRQLTTEGTGDGWLSWSPDTTHIVYLSHRFDDWSYANGTLWVINVETGDKRQLTFNPPPQ